MRILFLVVFIMSFSAFAQTRVSENIKQQTIATSEDGQTSSVKKPSKGK